jgi:glycosyltransferase involved in cell wall biosynthesis
VIGRSEFSTRIVKLIDMISSAVILRSRYHLVIIEVYSDLAFSWAYLVCQVCKLLQKPVILTLQGGRLPEFSQKWPGPVERLLNAASIVATPSMMIRTAFKKWRSDIYYLPNGIAIDRYPYKIRLLVDPNLVWLRAFHFIYNPELAVKVLSLLKAKFPGATLTMIGPDKGDGSLQAVLDLAKELKVIGDLKIIPGVPKDEVPDWLSQADIFLNTTNYDSFGVSVMEAAACGLPIVTTDAGEHAYLWTHEQDAMLVPVNDAQAMSGAVLSILNDPDLAERLSRSGRKKVEVYDWSIVLPQWCSLIEQTLSTQG